MFWAYNLETAKSLLLLYYPFHKLCITLLSWFSLFPLYYVFVYSLIFLCFYLWEIAYLVSLKLYILNVFKNIFISINKKNMYVFPFSSSEICQFYFLFTLFFKIPHIFKNMHIYFQILFSSCSFSLKDLWQHMPISP